MKAATYKHSYTDSWVKDGEFEYRKCETCDNQQKRKIGEKDIVDVPPTDSSPIDTNSSTPTESSSPSSTNTETNVTINNNSNDNQNSNEALFAILIGVGGAVLILGIGAALYFVFAKKKR